MAMKVHGAAVSTCTRRVITTLNEKGVSFELVQVDMAKGEHKSPEFLKLQPFGQIPVLEDGDLKIFESRAIARYIATKYAGQGTELLGSTPEEKALVDNWLEVEGQNYNPPCAKIVFEKVFKPMFYKGTPDEAELEKQKEALGKVLDIYEAHLADNEYLAGNFFSLADLSHLPYTDYLITAAQEGDLLFSRPNVKAWWERISNREAFLKAKA
eukprot:TRINITY_DN3844_c0_g1_i1.p1 TRINITY_DN3844_c0_g1~~TRINITY_DN3844_c0_g1_i1.p1  ORF type:complete len:212 (+),score=61.76 TRINITY_DN3844_c0_g1_i1:187-822(+)